MRGCRTSPLRAKYGCPQQSPLILNSARQTKKTEQRHNQHSSCYCVQRHVPACNTPIPSLFRHCKERPPNLTSDGDGSVRMPPTIPHNSGLSSINRDSMEQRSNQIIPSITSLANFRGASKIRIVGHFRLLVLLVLFTAVFPKRVFPWKSLHKTLVNTIFSAPLSQFEFPHAYALLPHPDFRQVCVIFWKCH